MSQFSQRHILATSQRLATYAEIAGKYDFALLASSWDGRSVCIADAAKLRTTRTAVLLFDLRDDKGRRDRHDKVLLDYAGTVSDQTVKIRGKSTDVEVIWEQIAECILAQARDSGRPLNVLLDLSACPRYYAAALVSACLGKGLAATLTVVYAEGKYPRDKDVTFLSGKWRMVAVPGLDGRYDPAKKRFFLVSVGWEGWRTLRSVSQSDPDRVSLLFPDPASDPDYVSESERHNKDLIDQYCIPDGQVIRATACDAVEAWQRLTEANIEDRVKDNITYLMMGTKPHSLALALRATILGDPTVLYVVPEEHSVVHTEPNGVFWQYEFRDVTAIQKHDTDEAIANT